MSMIKETIYESPDIPEVNDYQLPPEPAVEDIERIHIDVEQAKKRFAGRFITADGVDFTGNDKKKLKGYNTGAYIIEFVGKEYPEAETVEQRFNRLQMEIAELEQDIQNGEEKSEPKMNLTKEHIQILAKQLEKVKFKETAGSHKDVKTVKEGTNAKTAGSHKDVKTVKEGTNASFKPFNNIAADSVVITDFEARLNKLEQSLGVIDLSNPILTSGSVAAAIDDLKTRVDSLNEAKLKSVEERLNNVVALQNQSQSDEFTRKVNELYEKVVQIQNSNDLLESVVLRLRTLAKLHEQAAEFSAKLNELFEMKNQSKEDLQNNKQILHEFQENLQQIVRDLKKDLYSVKTQQS
uniref:Dynactin subunit 2 n=1 Tax=Panagrolaimus sp. JU765 TaxID=591449 RepID=A0AC34QUS2_9BILA